MEFLITRAELLLVCLVSNSESYEMHKGGSLSRPVKWCGKGTRFCLRTASTEFARLNKLEPPTDATILRYWNSIIESRDKKAELKLVKKAKKSS